MTRHTPQDTNKATLALVILGLRLLPCAASAAPACEWIGGPENPTLLNPGPWLYYFRTTSGSKCTGYYYNHGTRIARYKNMALDRAPQHGAVLLHANASVNYQSIRGYKGPDQFTIEVCGDEGGRSGCAKFEYRATVD